MIEPGNQTNETCNRDGCIGIIEEYTAETSCSCYINPPCSHCTDDRHYCPVCGWSGSDEQNAQSKISAKNAEYYAKANREFSEQRDSFYKKYNTGENINKLEMRIESHTHFTQKVIGIFPAGTQSKKSIYAEVKGTFGGRFIRFDDYRFEFIAYTD